MIKNEKKIKKEKKKSQSKLILEVGDHIVKRRFLDNPNSITS